MIRFKDISIPKPCSVDYDSLPYDEVKRFCGSCEKHVYDFRGKDEAYLNGVFQQTGKACGVYYEDQIQKPSLKTQRPFYYAFVTKAISLGLFLKTLLNTHDTSASIIEIPQTTQQAMDSTIVKVAFKNRPYNYSDHYVVSLFINNILYKSKINANDGFIFLPDTIQTTDKIKVVVKHTKFKSGRIEVYSVRNKKYNFTLENSDDILVEINFNKHFSIKRRRRLAGVPYGFW